jgi:hypothetical protein
MTALEPQNGAGREPTHELDQFERELLRYPLSLLPQLPLATSFVLEVPGLPIEVRGMSARLANVGASLEAGCDGPGGVVLDGDELAAIALGVRAERLSSADCKGFCLLKLQDPGFRIDEAIAMAGAQASAQERSDRWSLARVLAALGLRLQGAELLAPAPSLRPSRPPNRDHEDYGRAA